MRRGVMAALFALATAGPLALGLFRGAGARRTRRPVPRPRRPATALESWKKGDTIDALKSGSPPIVAQDFDWMAGHRLVGYEVTGDGKDDDANLRIPVDAHPPDGAGQGGQEERLLRRRHEPGSPSSAISTSRAGDRPRTLP